MLVAARDSKVRRFVYATSSSVYGDSKKLPKREDRIGKQLSPYAVSKYANELYATVFGQCYGLETIGLRYFNVFGPRQDPMGSYAAVVPRWIGEMLAKKKNVIYGDGQTSRDFCYVANVVQGNILAGMTNNHSSLNEVYNVACGQATSLTLLHAGIRTALQKFRGPVKIYPAAYRPFREGDVRHSLATIAKARLLLGYRPSDLIDEGITKTVQSYLLCRL
jgi:UDP-N-acetylglucosamine 4-epimerase